MKRLGKAHRQLVLVGDFQFLCLKNVTTFIWVHLRKSKGNLNRFHDIYFTSKPRHEVFGQKEERSTIYGRLIPVDASIWKHNAMVISEWWLFMTRICTYCGDVVYSICWCGDGWRWLQYHVLVYALIKVGV